MQALGPAGRGALATAAKNTALRPPWLAVESSNAAASCSSAAVQPAPMHAAMYKRRGRRRHLLLAAHCTHGPTSLDLGPSIRSFSYSTIQRHRPTPSLRDPYKPSFFYSSRPDFLPSGIVTSSTSVQNQSALAQDSGREAAHKRRYLLPPGTVLDLPDYDEVSQNHHALLRAVNTENVSDTQAKEAWQEFVPVFRASMSGNEQETTLDVRLFDATFWAATSESPRETSQQLEIFNRARLLYEYAMMQNIEMTALQTRRLAYLYIMCWEQHDLRRELFALADFSDTLLMHADVLDHRHISRLLSRMATNRMFEQAQRMLWTWANAKAKRKQPRVERVRLNGEEGSNSLIHTSAIANTLHQLDNASFEHTIEALLREHRQSGQASRTAKQLGLLVLQYGTSSLLRQPTAQKFLMAYLDTGELIELLPISLRDLLADGESQAAAYKGAMEEVDAALLASNSSDSDWRDLLVLTTTMLLARKGDLQLAERLLAADEQTDLPKRWRKELNELYAECVVITSRKAVNEPDLSKLFAQVKLALRFFSQCDWRRVRLDLVVHRILIRAFSRVVLQPPGKRQTIAHDKDLLDMLRRLTTRVLEHDADLDTLHRDGHTGVFHLLRQHIALRDYPYAKQIFLVNRTRVSEAAEMPFSSSDFHWLFGNAIDNEENLAFASQLLRFYIWSDLPQESLPRLDHKLLIRYVKRVRAIKRDEALKNLKENLLDSTLADVQKRNSSAAVGRLVDLVMAAHTVSQSFMADFVVDILDLSRPMLSSAAMARPQCIALEALNQRRSETVPRTRELILDTFERFRERAVEHASTIFSDSRATDVARRAYIAAIQIRLWEAGQKKSRESAQGNGPLQSAKMLLNEFDAVWRQETPSAMHCALRIDIALFEGALDDASRLFKHGIKEGSAPDAKDALPATIASRLALALGAADRFEEASEILAKFHRHRVQTVPIRRSDQQLLEIASLALLCMQDEMADLAVHRAITLMRAGVLPLPSDVSIQQRVLQQRQGLPLSYEVQRQIVAQQERAGRRDDDTPIDFVSAAATVSPRNKPLWPGRVTLYGDWNGLLTKMRTRLERWLVEGVPLPIGEAPQLASANPKTQEQDTTSARIAIIGAAATKDDVQNEDARLSRVEPAAPATPDEDVEWDPKEDKRRTRAFATLASGQRWSASS